MVLRVITVAFAAMHLGACPYMNNERTDLTGVVNPHTARDSATVTRRTLLKTIQPPRPARTLIFTTLLDFLGDLFATIFNWILSFFGFGPRGEPKTLREAISFGREDIAGLLNDDRAAEVLRLAFHDCTTGICDGCIDLSNLDNGGLADPVEYLKPIVEEYADFLTRGISGCWRLTWRLNASSKVRIVSHLTWSLSVALCVWIQRTHLTTTCPRRT